MKKYPIITLFLFLLIPLSAHADSLLSKFNKNMYRQVNVGLELGKGTFTQKANGSTLVDSKGNNFLFDVAISGPEPNHSFYFTGGFVFEYGKTKDTGVLEKTKQMVTSQKGSLGAYELNIGLGKEFSLSHTRNAVAELLLVHESFSVSDASYEAPGLRMNLRLKQSFKKIIITPYLHYTFLSKTHFKPDEKKKDDNAKTTTADTTLLYLPIKIKTHINWGINFLFPLALGKEKRYGLSIGLSQRIIKGKGFSEDREKYPTYLSPSFDYKNTSLSLGFGNARE